MYVALAIVLAAWLLYRKLRGSQPRREVPGGVSVFAQVKDIESFNESLFKMAEVYKEHGLARGYIGPMRFTAIWEPRYVEIVARSPQSQLKGNTMNVLFGELTSGPFTHPGGPDWQELRKPLTKSMAPRYIEKDYFKVFLSKSHDLVDHIRQHGEGKLLDISDDLCPIFVDMFFETNLGVKPNEFFERRLNVNQLIDEVATFYISKTLKLHHIFWRMAVVLSRPVLILKDSLQRILSLADAKDKREEARVEDVVGEKKHGIFKLFDELVYLAQYQAPVCFVWVRWLVELVTDRDQLNHFNTGIDRILRRCSELKKTCPVEGIDGVEYYNDFLIRRMKKKKTSWKQYCKEITDLIVAGSETPSSACSAAVLFLAMFSELQAAVHQELLEIFGDSDREPMPEDVARMKLLDRVIKETLRHIAPLVIFKTLENDLMLDEWKLPRGSFVMLALQQLHKNPLYWERPADFYPDHFLPESEAARPSYAFVPFGIGQRKCPGFFYAMVVMKVILSTMIRNFILSTPLKFDELRFDYKLLLYVKGGYPVKFRSR